jgi:DNA-binding CsgD family transcriptional regulator
VAWAEPTCDDSVPTMYDFSWLVELVKHIRYVIAEDPSRAELLRSVPLAVERSDILQVLFAGLFPHQHEAQQQAYISQKRLTSIQLEVLAAVATGATSGQIAEQRGCTISNVNNILKSIERRLGTGSPQESVALAISMGLLPLNVMDFVRRAGNCEPSDFDALGWNVSANGLANVEDAGSWQEIAACGLFLMLAVNTVSAPLRPEGEARPASGIICRIEPETRCAEMVTRVVDTGRLCLPCAIAIAPLAGERHGFTPGSLFVVSYLRSQAGLNLQEIVEYSRDGKELRRFCGGRTVSARLSGCNDLAFASDGALLATGGGALLRFTRGGDCVEPHVLECCTSVCPRGKGGFSLAHSSSRGGSIGDYTGRGTLRRTFAQTLPGVQLSCLRSLRDGSVAVMRSIGEAGTVEIYDAGTAPKQCWSVPAASYGGFAFNDSGDRLYIACPADCSIAVYSLAGRLLERIQLGERIAPAAICCGPDGAIWCVGHDFSALIGPPAA